MLFVLQDMCEMRVQVLARIKVKTIKEQKADFYGVLQFLFLRISISVHRTCGMCLGTVNYPLSSFSELDYELLNQR